MNSPCSPDDWEQLLEVYQLTEEEAVSWKGNPIDSLEPLAGKKVPILIVYGDADEVVPFEENGAILIERYRKLGGPIEDISKPGVGHHPHSLEDPKPIVQFILKTEEKEKKEEKVNL